jgi:hypothetical protein
MALKNLDQLKAEIDLAVHPDGPLGKTTAPNLNALLKSLATELTTAAATQPLTNVVQLTTDQRVAGTKTFTDQLVLAQQADQPKGILVNGAEVYESTNTSDSGVRIALGVNRDGNRQLWIGDDSAYGRYDKGVLRYQTGTRLPRLDAVSGDGNNRMNIAIGTNTSNVAIGGENDHPSERLEVFGNVKANQFIGDGSRLTGIGQMMVEQDLASNSKTNVPSVAAIVSKLDFVDNATTAATLWVRSGSPVPGVRGNVYYPFSSLPEALTSAQAGDTIIVLPGGTGVDALGRAYYNEEATVENSLRIIFSEGVIYGGTLIIGRFAGYNAYTTSIYGGEFINRILMCRQYTQSALTVHNARFTGALGGVQYVANHFDNVNSFTDTYLLRDCVFDTTRPVGSNAPIRNHGRDEFGTCDMTLDNCLVITDNTPCITYSTKLGGHVIVSGTTELRPGAGQAALESLPVVPSYVTVPPADWFVDNRLTTALDTRIANLQRNSIKYVDGALDSRFMLYANTQAYAFTGPAAAVTYAKANALTGLFLFRDTITEPIELLDNCTYDATGCDSIVSSGNQPNFATVGACRASLKIRRIIRAGNAEGVTVAISGAGTAVQLEGDILLDSSNTTQGIFNYSGASLRYRGNIEARQSVNWPIAQHGVGCTTDFSGNILTNTTSHCIALYCLGGVFDFFGRIDVMGIGNIAQCHPNAGGTPWLRLNLLGATTKDKGLYLHNVEPCRFSIKGVIDMRTSLLNDPNTACGLYVTQPYQVDIGFENLTILTKSGIPSVKGQTNVTANCLIPVVGKFYATEAPQPGEFLLQNITPYSFP